MARPDIRVENHGSIFLLQPISKNGNFWLNEHAPADAQWWGAWPAALVVEPRYVADIVNGAREDGPEVR